MSSTAAATYTLHDRGTELSVETWVDPEGKERNRARLQAWGEAHPNLYAARHVVTNVGGTVLAILGVSALLKALISGLLPNIELGFLPDLDRPDWLKYVIGFVVAVSIAVRETRRRKKIAAKAPVDAEDAK